MDKIIWHLDLDSFFVSAERLKNPSLRGIPVAVGGNGPRSVIALCSYEARAFGVRSAMPTAQALRLCPQLIICGSSLAHYAELSKQVFELLVNFTPVFEVVSIDEAYLDMTGTHSLFGSPREAAAKLRAEILAKIGLTASIGIGPNRLVAKIATDHCKPNGVLEILAGSEATFLAPLSVAKLPGCGKVTEKWLRERSILTIAQLQAYPEEVLERHLGKFGVYLHQAAFGKGSTEFHEEAKSRSISRETTFDKDLADRPKLEQILWEMASELGSTLRKENAYARTIRLKLRYPPFFTVTRSRILAAPTQTDRALYDAVVILLNENWSEQSPLRLLGMACVLGEKEHQWSLFDDVSRDQKQDQLEHLKDLVKVRFGTKALRTGRDIK